MHYKRITYWNHSALYHQR